MWLLEFGFNEFEALYTRSLGLIDVTVIQWLSPAYTGDNGCSKPEKKKSVAWVKHLRSIETSGRIA